MVPYVADLGEPVYAVSSIRLFKQHPQRRRGKIEPGKVRLETPTNTLIMRHYFVSHLR
jgi:hypothetical protein